MSEIDEDFCRLLDKRMYFNVNWWKVRQTGYESFHMAACFLLFKGESLGQAAEILGATKSVVMYATGKLGLKWKQTKGQPAHKKRPESAGAKKDAESKQSKSRYMQTHKIDPKTGKTRECSKCGAVFEVTAVRKMLCFVCYKTSDTEETIYSSKYI